MALPVAALPVLPDDDSMLSRKFGRELANYFSGSPLNRVSFLRSDHAFLQAAFAHPAARFLLVDDLKPLVHDATPPRLAWSTQADIRPLTGPAPFAHTEQEAVAAFNSADEPHPVVLFLGIDEKKRFAGSAATAALSGFTYNSFAGNPFFAVDVTPRGPRSEQAAAVVAAAQARGLVFFEHTRSMNLDAEEAAAYAQARALLDWNARNPFCAQCGQPTLSVHAGTKRVCPPTDFSGVVPGQPPAERRPCAARKGVSNLSFPRTDPTVIMACVSADGQRILLGRNRRYPPHWYSTLAGFLEPGESIEEAVRREVWEESGVAVGRVVLHSSQPWPYPANLMVGAICVAQPGDGEKIFLGHDPELQDARWFTRDEVHKALQYNTTSLEVAVSNGYKEGELRLPPSTAIANQLLVAVVSGFADEVSAKI